MSRISFLFVIGLTLGGRCFAAPALNPFDVMGEESLSLDGPWKFKTAARDVVPEPSDIIIDNADKERVEVVGPNWTVSQWKEGGAYWGENYMVATKRSANMPSYVLFKPTIPQAATYEVFGTWSRGERDSAVKITIQSAGKSQTVQVDQAKNGPRWFSLGRFSFAAGAGNTIKVDASGAGAQVVADAFLLRPVRDTETGLPYSATFSDTDWETISVPGNWDTHNSYANYTGQAWYRRQFTPPVGWQGSRLRLRFDAVYHDAAVYLNGKLLGEHNGGYTPFDFDVTAALRYGQPNFLAVRADNTYRRGAWWPWGGISRSVQLLRNNEVRIVAQQIRAEPDLATGKADVFMRLTLQNDSKTQREVRLDTRIGLRGSSEVAWTSADASALATSIQLPAGGQKSVEWKATLPASRVKLWDFDHPNLYDCQTTATVGGRLQHLRRDHFGIRKVEVTPTQLLLNGEPIRMPGFNRIYDHRAWGNTEPEFLVRQDVDTMKRLGANLMRIMHGAQSPALLDYMDEKGVLIFEEIPVWGGDDPRQREAGNPTTRRWLGEMIERDFNHPCIIGWSVGNELTGHYDYVKTMIDMVRKDLDSHRLLGYVSYTGVRDNMGPQNDPITFSDLTMHNNYHSLASAAGTLRERWPNKPIFFTEFGSRQIGESLDAKLSGLEANMDDIRRTHPEVVGISLWTYNDYRSPYKDSAFSENRTWGVVNVWRQPKRAFAQIAAQFSPIRALSLENATQNSAILRLEPRAAVDFPSYMLRDYQLKWELRRKNGTIAEGGLLALPTIKPGDAPIARTIAWKALSTPAVDIVLSLIAPTGYVVHETRAALDVPEKPQISAVLAGNQSIRVLFKPVAGASEYKVLYRAANQTAPQESKATIDNQVTVSGLTNGLDYQFSVVALDDKGASPPSDAANGSPGEQALPPRLWTVVPTDGGFVVGYAVEKEDQSFDLEYGTQPDKFTQSLQELKVKGAATVSGLRNGTLHYFRMRRRGTYGMSGWSQTMAVTPNGQLPPTTPTILGGVRGDGQISLRFEPSEGAISYRVRYKKVGASDSATTEIDVATVTQATIKGLDNAQSYTCAIAAVGIKGVSPFSAPLTIPIVE